MRPNQGSPPPGRPPGFEQNAPLDPAAVAASLRAAAADIERHQNKHSRRQVRLIDDPIRTKNLEKVLGHLRQFAAALSSLAQGETREDLPDLRSPSTLATLDELAASLQPANHVSGASAWEFADQLDLLDLQTLRWPRLGQVLRHRALYGGLVESDRRYVCRLFIRLRRAPEDAAAQQEARAYLAEVQREAMAEYRRSRAKIALRKRYLTLMSLSLAFLLLAFAVLFVLGAPATGVWWSILSWLEHGQRFPIYAPAAYPQLVPVAAVVLAGALGAVLSRAVNLKNADPLQSAEGTDPRSPLGLRELSSTGTVFIAQAAIGAVSALVIYLVFQAGLLTVEKAGGSPGLAFYSLVGFLAGYAEAWFIGTVGRAQNLI
jgi:hypothetical protein